MLKFVKLKEKAPTSCGEVMRNTSGKVSRRSLAKPEAPSTVAASYISAGSAWSAAKHRIMLKGKLNQRFTMMMARRAPVGSVSHGTEGRCTLVSQASTAPKL